MEMKGKNLNQHIYLSHNIDEVQNTNSEYIHYNNLSIKNIIPTFHNRTIRLIFGIICFGYIFQVNNIFAKEISYNFDGYNYVIVYETSADESLTAAIDIFSENSNKLLEKISNIPPEECKKSLSNSINDTLKSVNRKCFAICQHDAQRRQTLYIMSEGKNISSIDFDASEPNLKWDNEISSFVAIAIHRFLNTFGTISNYLVAYTWNPEVSLMQNANPTFNKKTYQYYYDYYQSLKEFSSKNRENLISSIEPMVIALASTASIDTICRELSLPPFTTMSTKKLAEINELAEKIGFPTIEINKCKKGE